MVKELILKDYTNCEEESLVVNCLIREKQKGEGYQ
jgi:hypothetical protein